MIVLNQILVAYGNAPVAAIGILEQEEKAFGVTRKILILRFCAPTLNIYL